MPYPHLIQFETLDRRRVLPAPEVGNRTAVRPGRRRSALPGVRRLRRSPRCAAGAV